MASFKELCGLSSVANLMQCMLAVSPRFLGPDNTPLVVLNLSEQYPTMELQGIVPEVLKKIVTTYDTVSSVCFCVAWPRGCPKGMKSSCWAVRSYFVLR